MVFLNELQKETLILVDDMIEKGKTFEDISDYLYNNNYIFSQEVKNGHRSKTRFSIEKIVRNENGTISYKNTYVDLIKRRNGFAYWETIRLY